MTFSLKLLSYIYIGIGNNVYGHKHEHLHEVSTIKPKLRANK